MKVRPIWNFADIAYSRMATVAGRLQSADWGVWASKHYVQLGKPTLTPWRMHVCLRNRVPLVYCACRPDSEAFVLHHTRGSQRIRCGRLIIPQKLITLRRVALPRVSK